MQLLDNVAYSIGYLVIAVVLVLIGCAAYDFIYSLTVEFYKTWRKNKYG